MIRNKKSGFTLVELMVVIVIIGVLATLAIPRFNDATNRAKVAEAPRVLASFESAATASFAEVGHIPALDDLPFEIPKDSRWWTYTEVGTGVTNGGLQGIPQARMGAWDGTAGNTIHTTWDASDDKFVRGAVPTTAAKRYIPNW